MESQQIIRENVLESSTIEEPLAKRSRLSNEKVSQPIIDKIIKNPGLQHVSEDIFQLLDKKSLMNCRLVNRSWKNVMDQANFWFKKLKEDERDLFENSDEDEEENKEDDEKEDEKVDFFDSLKNLHQVLRDDLQYDFILVLMGIYKGPYCKAWTDGLKIRKQPKCLLEIVIALNRTEQINVELSKFIMEYVDPYSTVAIPGDLSLQNAGLWTNGQMPVHLAASYGFVALVKKLIKKYDSAMVRTEDGLTPIHFAASNGHSNVVEFLATLTGMPNAPEYNGVTPIHLAAENGHLNVVEVLAPLTDTPDTPDDGGNTPIVFATLNGHKNIVEFLAPLTDDPNAPDVDGITPIHIAASNGRLEILKFLLNFTDSPNAPDNDSGDTPIHIAALEGYLDIVKLLAPLSENPNHKNANGLTAIDIARNQGHEHVAEFLEDYYKKQ